MKEINVNNEINKWVIEAKNNFIYMITNGKRNGECYFYSYLSSKYF